jgi:hydroxymethylbilane synthase
VDRFVPCAGQGALAIQMHSKHTEVEKVRSLNHQKTFLEVSLERLVLQRLGGDCTMPCGVHVNHEEDRLEVRAVVLDDKGGKASAQATFTPNQGLSGMADIMIEKLKDDGLVEVFKELNLNLPDA